jgi:hypothetical protein
MTTDNFCFYLQNRLIPTSQTGGQWHSDATPFSIPCLSLRAVNYDSSVMPPNFGITYDRYYCNMVTLQATGLPLCRCH